MISNYATAVNEVPDELFSTLCKAIDERLAQNPEGAVAAFDADGTLWDFDIAEVLFQYEIDHALVALPADPWGHYHALKAEHPPRAYAWLAGLHAGKTVTEVHAWTREALKETPPPVFRSIERLFEFLKKRNVEIFVVSASTQWAVEVGIKAFGLSPDRALGVGNEVDHNGLITEKLIEPVTWRAGKREALKLRVGERPIVFCAGNTMGDAELLGCSDGAALAVKASTLDGHYQSELLSTERELQALAEKNGWYAHEFRI